MPKDGRSELVQVIDLIKTFGKNEAVKGVSFTIGKGEIFGLLGPNGAGKSTTINIMCGYLEPTSGDTIIDGISVSREPMQVKSLLGVVPQEIALYKDFNSLENLVFFGELYGMPAKERQERADEILHIAIMDEGRIIAMGTLEQLLALRDQTQEVQRPHGLQDLFIQLTGKTLRD